MLLFAHKLNLTFPSSYFFAENLTYRFIMYPNLRIWVHDGLYMYPNLRFWVHVPIFAAQIQIYLL